ncbi:hypothetical protein IQ233_15115 [Nodularia sp. LEGE 06071]|uniref:hypothetical protein n=1 Tax=unclassified Nodularia (in: cyanobacteria) TaxID=2656917 RepID=UPI001880FB99|nr:hypothetical protein [Nodularia sp. LEGE 06071]MBE9200427.1 hypothetical protein [Nodularia sp. LEGE 06071]
MNYGAEILLVEILWLIAAKLFKLSHIFNDGFNMAEINKISRFDRAMAQSAVPEAIASNFFWRKM